MQRNRQVQRLGDPCHGDSYDLTQRRKDAKEEERFADRRGRRNDPRRPRVGMRVRVPGCALSTSRKREEWNPGFYSYIVLVLVLVLSAAVLVIDVSISSLSCIWRISWLLPPRLLYP